MATTATETNKGLFREHLDALTAGDLDAAASHYVDGYTSEIMHVTGEREEVDVEGLRENWEMIHEAFPDMTHEVHEVAAEGDWVIGRLVLSGTHEGAFFGLEPTGNAVEIEQYASYKFDDGEIVEANSVAAGITLLNQLDVDLPLEL